jgi:hypothetical protein
VAIRNKQKRRWLPPLETYSFDFSHETLEAFFLGLADGAQVWWFVSGAEIAANFTAPDRQGKFVFINLDRGFICHYLPHLRRGSSFGD